MKIVKRIANLAIAAAAIAVLAYSCSKDGSSEGTYTIDGKGGSTARFAIAGDYLYTVDRSNLQSFQIGPSGIEARGKTKLSDDIETVFAYKNSLLIGAETGVYLVDISNPGSPLLKSVVQHFRACDPVVADSNFAYVTVRSGNTCGGFGNELQVLNISDIQNPLVVKRQEMTNPKGLGIAGKELFVCDNGIKRFSLTNPTNPQQTGYLGNLDANDLIALNSILVVSATDGIYQVNHQNGNLTILSKIEKVP
ncbi:MAG TPA: hypothetical protein VFV37_07465 [Luteibaculaceae bacterium]|nr:hypothetical protein [Luteibaculaceae bacterium]